MQRPRNSRAFRQLLPDLYGRMSQSSVLAAAVLRICRDTSFRGFVKGARSRSASLCTLNSTGGRSDSATYIPIVCASQHAMRAVS